MIDTPDDDWLPEVFSEGLSAPVDALYDRLIALRRTVVDLERDYRTLSARDDLHVDTLGAATTPGQCLANLTEALVALNQALAAAEDHWASANHHAARLYRA